LLIDFVEQNIHRVLIRSSLEYSGRMDTTRLENNDMRGGRMDPKSPTKAVARSPRSDVSNEKSSFRRPVKSSDLNVTITKVANGEESGNRIVYEREALLKIRVNSRPLPDLQIPPDLMRTRKLNSPAEFYSVDRKKNGGTPTPSSRKENSESPREDVISLRPHSGNFSSGCTPNLSPNNGPLLSRFHTQEDQTKSFFDRDYSRPSNLRYPPMRIDPQDRSREKLRGREERPARDFDNERNRDGGRDRERFGRDQDRNFRGTGNRAPPAENGRRSYGQGYQSWGSDEPGDWNRRKSNDQGHYRREYQQEQEPEWFSEGPVTYNDTIELRGFHDDDRQEGSKTGKDNMNKDLKVNHKKVEGPGKAPEPREKNSPKPEGTDISLDNILALDQISNILTTNGLLEHEEPSGSSRFSQLFQRYSETSRQGQEINGPKRSSSQDNVTSSTPDIPNQEKGIESGGILYDAKTKTARDIEVALRNILIPKPVEVEQEQEVNKDAQAFKKLLDQIVVKGESHLESPKRTQNVPKPSTDEELSPMSDAFARIAKLDHQPKPNPDLQAIFASLLTKGRVPDSVSIATQPGTRRMPQNAQIPPRQMLPPQNPATEGFRPIPIGSHFAPRNPGVQQQQRPSFTPFEVLNLLPLEMQTLVLGAKLGPEFMKRPDVMQIINALNTGEVILVDIIQQLGAPHNPHKPVLAGVLKLGLNGVIPIPGLVYVPVGLPPHLQNVKLPPPPNAYQHLHHPQYPPHPQFVMHHPNHGPPQMHLPNQGNPHHAQPHFNGGHHGF